MFKLAQYDQLVLNYTLVCHVHQPLHTGDVTTPDLISIIDVDSGYPVTTEDLQYGLRVAVVAMAADPKMKTAAALRVVGPRAFGFNFDYLPYR